MSAPRVRMAWMRWGVYACFFLSGATSLVFEVLWSRQFVTVFGNSSYAISVVLCAYMAGLGLGGLIGGRIADRILQRVAAFGGAQVAVAGWALAMPLLLAWFRLLVPMLPVLSPESLLVSTLTRFALSFVLLVVPCFLMGITLPLLVRAVTNSDRFIGRSIGALYCWNTLGAAFGCWAAGFWMLDTLGLRLTNQLAAGVSMLVALAAVALSRPLARAADPFPAEARQSRTLGRAAATRDSGQPAISDRLVLSVAFVNGLASLACEVLWFRYLAFVGQSAYVFPRILCIYLLGLGLGGFIYDLLAGRIQFSVKALGVVEALLAIAVPAAFVASALVFASGPPQPLELRGMAWLTLFVPTVLMGVAFPLLCSVYGRRTQVLGRRVGVLFATNTAGTVIGSFLPVFVLVPLVGIQMSLLLVSLLCGAMSLIVLARGAGHRRSLLAPVTVVCAVAFLSFFAVVPSDLCQRVFLATDFNLARHTDILFYREGLTGTAIVTRDRADQCKTIYINGCSEVPVLYEDRICFKLLGALGPMLHPRPDKVLMICFGGGIAAGTTTQLPDVKSVTIVDLESSVVEAARTIPEANNDLLENPKTHIVIDDGRNYIMTAGHQWPVIISDSTHPKTPDSWVLYTQEFYRLVRDHLTDDGVFVEWVPKHGLRTAEFKIIARTFQSVFRHASLWVTQGMNERGQFVAYGLLVGTLQPLKIDVSRLCDRLNAEAVRLDLQPFGLHTPAGFLDAFICGEDTLRQWVGEGPINTDDLPYTYYETRYSKGMFVEPVDFIEPMEDIWPFLTGTGSEESAKQLHDELGLRMKVNRLAVCGRAGQAYALLPQDIRYGQMGRFCEAGPRYAEKLLKVYWDNPNGLLFLLSFKAAGPGGLTAEKPIFERVLELDPENVSALNLLGAMRSDAGDHETAEKYLRRAASLAPSSAVVRQNLALELERTGRHAEALQHWRAAAAVSEDGRAADQWGVRLAQEGRVEDAVQWFRRAVEIQPTLVSARLHLALWLHRTGRTQEALTHVRYVMKLDPENRELADILGRLDAKAVARSGR